MPRDLYKSSNGDLWVLARDGHTGLPVVEHTPNHASGGRPTVLSLAQFLAAQHLGPEHAELLRLIAGLADQSADPARSRS
jgi:hypothetical protein